jgi:hemerythrin-like domain-containing protein
MIRLLGEIGGCRDREPSSSSVSKDHVSPPRLTTTVCSLSTSLHARRRLMSSLRRVAQAVDSVLADREILRQNVDHIVRDFIEYERRHIMMEDRDFFPATLKALEPQDWTEIAAALTSHEDPLFSEAAEETFDAVRARILELEQEAEAERH